jgi:hypothetical protein
VFTDDFDRQVCQCNRLKDLRGHAADAFQYKILKVSFEGAGRVQQSGILHFEGSKTPGNRLLI